MSRQQSNVGRLGLLPKELATGVGPELLHHIKQSIKANLLSPLVGSVAKGTVLRRIIEIRNTGGDGVSSQLGCIELVVTVVATGDGLATDRIPGSLPEATSSLGEVTRILMESHGEQSLSHKVANRLIGERSPVVFTKPFCPLSEMRILFLCHRDSCKDPGYEKGRGIEGIVYGDLKFGASRQRLNLPLALIGPVVRNHPEDVILADLIAFTAGLRIRLGCLLALILRLRRIRRRYLLRERGTSSETETEGNLKAAKS